MPKVEYGMLKSMTGYGKATATLASQKIQVEIKSLNSRSFDLNLRMPNAYREKELSLRSELSSIIGRGKVDLYIHCEQTQADEKATYNGEVIANYYQALKQIADDLKVQNADLFAQVMKMPETIRSDKGELNENEWVEIKKVVLTAVEELDAFRKNEGNALQQDILSHLNEISSISEKLSQFEEARMKNVKKKIRDRIDQHITAEKIDETRLEQELIYYMEKLDISEEKVRLKSHCDYFLETLENATQQGKKLGFILQEIGREINTIGSKANDLDIQKLVVKMKDELEKIREQVQNVL